MSPEQILRTYADLADLYDRQNQPKQRDWFLVLAADAALSAGLPAEADRLLGRLLSLNPHHLLRPFASFAEALRSPDVEGYVGSLRRSYPPARAEQILQAEQNRVVAGEPPTLAEEAPRPAPRPAAVSVPAQAEDPQVIFARLRSAPEQQAPPSPPPPPPRPAPPRPAARPPAPMPRPRPVSRAPASPPAPSPAPEPRPARPRSQAPPPEPLAGGSPIVPTGLFMLLLVVGIGLAVYTFARPFLPAP